MSVGWIRNAIGGLSLAAVVALSAWPKHPAMCQTERDDDSTVSRELKLPVYQWRDASKKQQGVVIAVHGLMKHGAVFEKLGGYLAPKGYVVVAQDLRGYGRWLDKDSKDNKNDFGGGEKVCYEKSYYDLVNLTVRMHSLYPGQPVFIVGESLGADLALRLAGVRPDLTDGLILASPAISHHHSLCKAMVTDAAKFVTNPGRQFNMVPYIKNFTSEDPRIVDESLQDPHVRRRLNLNDLLCSRKTMKQTLAYVKNIPPHIPVLIFQGSADKIVKADAIVDLMSNLKSSDQTVRWLDNRGHVLLETSYISDNTLDTIGSWLNQHLPVEKQGIKAASKPNTPTPFQEQLSVSSQILKN